MAHHDSPQSPQEQPAPQEQSAPQPPHADPTVPQAPVAAHYGEYDDARQVRDEPAPGWGAPQEQTPQYPGWGAPQQGGPEQLYAQPAPGWGAAPPRGPQSAAARWRGLSSTQKGLAAAAAAVVIAGGAGAAVWAANSTTSSTDGSTANGIGGAAGQGPGGFGGQNGMGSQSGTGSQGGTGSRGGAGAQGFQGQSGARGLGSAGGLGAGMLGQVLHGEFVVVQGTTNVTMVEQSGTVTGVSGQSVTVKSSDGYQQTYAISSSTQVAARGMRGQGGSGTGSSSTATLAQGQTVSVAALKDGLAAQTVMILGTGSTGTSN